MESAAYPSYHELRRRRIEERRRVAECIATDILQRLARLGVDARLTGSLADRDSFHESSDIDILIVGIPDALSRDAVEETVSEVAAELPVDLIYLDDVHRDHVRRRLLEQSRAAVARHES